MGVILDTSLLIAAERGRFDLQGFLAAQGQTDLGMASITASELLHGCERAVGATRRKERELFVEKAISRIPVIPFGLMEARHHARIWAQLAARGQTIGSHDMMIAATATSLHYEIATLNPKHFAPIPLKLVSIHRFAVP